MSGRLDEELWEKIASFELDEAGSQFPFTSRLAREQGWTHVFAGRVVMEYKRFIALAMMAGHPVTPSEEVDQVWHLHMVYTRSYWQGLCRDILGRELHHSPTSGGMAENEKFNDWYGKTLESYRQIFGTEPPADIWPPAEKRFANAGSGRWVDSSKFWLVPKATFLKRFFRP